MISVVVPAYNAKKYIGRCIRSILRQSYKDIELIVVNDCSTDNTLSVCQQMLTEGGGKNTILIDKPKNEGVDKARYDGVQAAHGEWIAFVDADDWLPVDAMQKLHQSAVVHNSDVVIGNARRCALNGLVSWPLLLYSENLENKSCLGEEVTKYIYMGNETLFVMWAHLFRSELIKQRYVPVNLIFCEDHIQNLRIIDTTDKVYCIPDTVYCYRYGKGVTSRFKIGHMDIMKDVYHAKKHEAERIGVYAQVAVALKRSYIASLEDYVAHCLNTKPIPKDEFLRIISEELQNKIYDELSVADYPDRTLADCILRRDAASLVNYMEQKRRNLPLKLKVINFVRRIL